MNAQLLLDTLRQLLAAANDGDLVFIRCLSAEDVGVFLVDPAMELPGWQIFPVGGTAEGRWITADRAVELREDKGPPALLLVDSKSAGAGMAGIYSAARELDEETLFSTAVTLAKQRLAREVRDFAAEAIKRARRVGGRRRGIGERQEFDFYGNLLANPGGAGRLLPQLGLWPVAGDAAHAQDLLPQSSLMVEKLLVPPATSQAPHVRIASLVLHDASTEQTRALEQLLRFSGDRPRSEILALAGESNQLWLGNLKPAFLQNELASLELVSWRRPSGAVFAWSGLRIPGTDELPHFIIDQTNVNTRLEVRWKIEPEHLPKGALTYQVRVFAGSEVLASRQVEHSGKAEQKALFTAEDFEDLEESAKLEATLEVTALGVTTVKPQRTEDFIVVFGEAPPTERIASGEVFRCLADGLAHAETRELLEDFVDKRQKGLQAVPDRHGFIAARLEGARRGFRVERPRLIDVVERQWTTQTNPLCRWSLRCRPDGFWTAQPEPIAISQGSCPEADWTRLQDAARKFRDDAVKAGGILSRFYLHGHASTQVTADYLNSYLTALDVAGPELALVQTVEVQNPAGRPVGTIVLPSHPLRVAWQSAYDTLSTHLRLDEKIPIKRVRENLRWIDGANFPFALPSLRPGESLVFGDVLGLTAVAMVFDSDREPKSTIATLAACFAEKSERIVPSLSEGSGTALAREVRHYLDTHPDFKTVHVHALRPGDGATVVRALGQSIKLASQDVESEQSDGPTLRDVGFRLDIYPTEAQSSMAGRHLIQLNQRRRSSSAALPEEDAWCLGSLPRAGNRSVPRLRWAKRDTDRPEAPAHLSLAFDTFTNKIVAEESTPRKHPLLAFGLIAHVKRSFEFADGIPCWRLAVPGETDGLKLPDRIVTDRLLRLHSAVLRTVARSLHQPTLWPILLTKVSPDDLETLRSLHRLSDWVITINRNAGIEFYDSPREVSGAAVFEAYVIDAVPERDDLGSLQMITSTAHFDEVRHLLDHTLSLMGLSSSIRNCEFLLNHLKALSGRLAMRLAAGADEDNAIRVGSELVGLALARTKCEQAGDNDVCWLNLARGFFIPLDDVRDLVPAKILEPEDPSETADDLPPEDSRRADLLFVTAAPRGRLVFRFVEVKYRRHLAMARSAVLREAIVQQTESIKQRWMDMFFGEKSSPSERCLRAARLCRILRFYCDKARRHYLNDAVYSAFSDEFDRYLLSPAEYQPAVIETPDRGYVFCPDYRESVAEELHPGTLDDCKVWLFGPDTLPDRPPTAAGVAAESTEPLPANELPPSDASGPALEPVPPAAAAADAPEQQPSADVDGVLQISLGMSRHNESIYWSPAITGNPHLMIVGLPGMGKTTALINICRQLVGGGILPIVFSYHDDIDEKLSEHFKDIVSTDCYHLGFNPMRLMHASPLGHVASAGQLRDIFSAIFPELGELQLEQLRGAIKESYVAAGWGSGASGPKPPEFRTFLDTLRAKEKPDARTLTLLARLNELDDFEFFGAEQGSASLLDCEKPQLIRIHSSANDVVQRAYASFVLYRIYQDMFHRGRQERITHAVIFDEAHRASRLKLIPTMAKECRKYGLSMIVASQEARDFDSALYSAIANYMVLRVTDQDARVLARNVAPSDLERRVADRLKALPKYEALLFSETNRHPVQVQLADMSN